MALSGFGEMGMPCVRCVYNWDQVTTKGAGLLDACTWNALDGCSRCRRGGHRCYPIPSEVVRTVETLRADLSVLPAGSDAAEVKKRVRRVHYRAQMINRRLRNMGELIAPRRTDPVTSDAWMQLILRELRYVGSSLATVSEDFSKMSKHIMKFDPAAASGGVRDDSGGAGGAGDAGGAGKGKKRARKPSSSLSSMRTSELRRRSGMDEQPADSNGGSPAPDDDDDEEDAEEEGPAEPDPKKPRRSGRGK